jgi:hypothetical protein
VGDIDRREGRRRGLRGEEGRGVPIVFDTYTHNRILLDDTDRSLQ